MYYFDHSATTQPSKEIMKVVQEVAMNFYANPSSIHQMGERSKALMQQARQQIANILNFKTDEIFFASSGTEVNNWVFQAILPALQSRHPDRKRVIISSIEHPSITAQIDVLEQQGYIVDLAPVTSDGVLDMTALRELLDRDVLILSSMAVNNEIGSLQPLEEIANLLVDFPQVIWHVDGIQAVTTQMACLLNSRIDLISLSSHKFHSIRGAGILAKRQRVQSTPFLYGGGQEAGLRSSTENLPALVAAAKALRLAGEEQAKTKAALGKFRLEILETFKANHWQVFAETTGSEHIICAAFLGVPGEVLVHAFEELNVIVSTTSACSSRKHQAHHTLKAMGVNENISTSAIRISMSQTTTSQEVAELNKAIQLITQKFVK